MSSGETIEIELTDPQAAILASNEDRNLWMGGQGSGKTAGMGFLTYNFNAFVPDVMGLIAANTYSQLTNSTLKEILKTWALMGFTKYSESTLLTVRLQSILSLTNTSSEITTENCLQRTEAL